MHKFIRYFIIFFSFFVIVIQQPLLCKTQVSSVPSMLHRTTFNDDFPLADFKFRVTSITSNCESSLKSSPAWLIICTIRSYNIQQWCIDFNLNINKQSRKINLNSFNNNKKRFCSYIFSISLNQKYRHEQDFKYTSNEQVLNVSCGVLAYYNITLKKFSLGVFTLVFNSHIISICWTKELVKVWVSSAFSGNFWRETEKMINLNIGPMQQVKVKLENLKRTRNVLLSNHTKCNGPKKPCIALPQDSS